MLGRKWRVDYDTCESGLGSPGFSCTSLRERYVGEVRMVPTVQNVRKYIAEKFPNEEIEETWENLFEQIHGDGNLAIGMFSISLKSHRNEEMIARSISFMEVY